jgi:hypothetical protein
MEKPNFAVVTKILTHGQWIEIKEGSLQGGGGLEYVTGPEVQPLFRFTLLDGEEGVILSSALHGWRPLVAEPVEYRPKAAELVEGMDEAGPNLFGAPARHSVFAGAHAMGSG